MTHEENSQKGGGVMIPGKVPTRQAASEALRYMAHTKQRRTYLP